MANLFNTSSTGSSGIYHVLIKFISATIILGITAFLTPGFTIAGMFPLLVSSFIISVLDYIVGKAGFSASPFGKGLTGFILSAIIIYITQIFVYGYQVTVLGALIGALFYGMISAFIPGKNF